MVLESEQRYQFVFVELLYPASCQRTSSICLNACSNILLLIIPTLPHSYGNESTVDHTRIFRFEQNFGTISVSSERFGTSRHPKIIDYILFLYQCDLPYSLHYAGSQFLHHVLHPLVPPVGVAFVQGILSDDEHQ